jgi:alcohol dehydrogenase, propanol-preferring
MRAYQLTAWQRPPEMREVPVPEPGPGQVLVKVGGAGACHSDLHLMEWPEGTMDFNLPFTSATRTPAGSRPSAPESKGWSKAKQSPSTAPGAAAAAVPAAARRRTDS